MIFFYKRILTLFIISIFSCPVFAQNSSPDLELGEKVYKITCATGYCHTPDGGGGGGAPRLAARDFELDYITRVVSYGSHETRMEGFAASLPQNELAAVITYVASMNGIRTDDDAISTSASPVRPRLTASEENGKKLMHDSLRAFNRCASCHRVEGSGVPVAAPVEDIPATAESLRSLATPTVSTITIAGESMPALILRQGARRTIFYDLTSSPPVRRNVDTAGIKVTAENSWRHSSFIDTYNSAELEDILAYLRAVRKRR